MFHGFPYPFQVSKASGRIAVERDYEAYVKGLIRQLLLTRPGERINRPRLGGGLAALVFAPLSDANAAIAQTAIHATLTEWLDAIIRLEDVRITAVPPSTLDVTVVYLIRATNERTFLNLEVTE
ncbi:GPW/gp25 family protein [Sphingomonas sp.]|uniref:GPW/gp25 family protein n=1 Tax=Sphingomonas sp. TaxID=28214 RepID=UPI003D6D2B49